MKNRLGKETRRDEAVRLGQRGRLLGEKSRTNQRARGTRGLGERGTTIGIGSKAAGAKNSRGALRRSSDSRATLFHKIVGSAAGESQRSRSERGRARETHKETARDQTGRGER